MHLGRTTCVVFAAATVLLSGCSAESVTLPVVVTEMLDAPPPAEPYALLPIGFTGGAPLLWADDADLERSLDAVAQSGSTRLRLDMAWPLIEPEPGLYVWEPTNRVVDAALARGIDVLAIIDYTPQWAAEDPSLGLTAKPSSAQQYGDFAGAVAQHFSGRVRTYEIWNEPNGSEFFAPAADPEFYSQMLQHSYDAIKLADPGAQVLGGTIGAVGDNANTMNGLTFLRRMYDAGAQGHFDALSVHAYAYPGTLTATEPVADGAMNLIVGMRREMVLRGDESKLMWATEFGSPADTGLGITEDRQAELMVSFIHEWSQLPFAGPMYVHEIRDRLAGSLNPEDNFGVLRRDYSPKPAYTALTEAIASGRVDDPDVLAMTAVARAHPSLGGALTPVYAGADRIGRSILLQQFSAGVLFRSDAGFAISPLEVSDLVVQSGFVPSGPYLQGMQQLDADGGARVFHSERTEAHLVRGSILEAWTPDIGFPVSEEYQDEESGGRATDFEFGRIVWTPDDGAKVENN